MKRLRSFDDDLDDESASKDWDRRHGDRSFDRRSSGSDRGYRDGDRIHRSESFSAFRRDFPKGFRSERRDRFGSSASSSSRRLNSENDRHRRDRDLRLRDGDDERVKMEVKAEKVIGESCSSSSSEMEEGELEPDPDPEPAPASESMHPDPEPTLASETMSVVARQEKEEIVPPVLCDDEKEGRILGTSGNDKVKESNDRKMHEEEKSINEEDEVREKKEILETNLAEEEKHGDKPIVEKYERKDMVEREASENNRDEDEAADPKKEASENHGDDRQASEQKIVVSKELKENRDDKKKSVALSHNRNENLVNVEDALEEGPSSRRGFELFFVTGNAEEIMEETSTGKHRDDKLELEPLDLSLGLPGVLPDHMPKLPHPKPGSPSHVRSVQSVPSSFRTNSDGFTTSMSFSGSQTFLHNPSCSLMQNSVDYEQSVGSHPLLQGVDWQAQTSNELKRKGGSGPLLQRVLVNGSTLHAKPDGLARQYSLPRQLSPTRSHGSQGDTRSEHNKDKRLLTRQRSSSSLFKSEQQPEGEQLVLDGTGFERIISKIVSEPVQLVSRLLQEMTDHSVSFLKEAICEMVISADKRGKLHGLQEVLQRRPDLTVETISKCPRTLLEILVAIKTGLPDLLRSSNNNVSSSDLAGMFHNLKCHNLACLSILPVDDCECKICTQRSGFCSACMCLLCSKFDNASNTCGWVGCDVCIHWCHTDCGLQDSRIRNGPCSGTQGTTEMQFHCVACNHPSEMFGFVKDVFMTCVKDWKAETLAKELQYVRRIFADSNDLKGKRLRDMANQMLLKLEDQANLSELVNIIIGFFSESKDDINNSISVTPPKEPSRNLVEGSNRETFPSKESTWLSSFPSDKVSHRENTGALPMLDYNCPGRKTKNAEIQMRAEKKPVVDELESLVRFKQAEAKMYQERADSARRESEGLKRIAVAKNVQIEEDYATKIARIQLSEAEERRRKKLEELQVTERAHREYFNMKMRMEAEISDLLVKMEATKRKFST